MIKVGDVVNGYTVLAIAARRLDINTVVDIVASGLVILARHGEDGEYVTARMARDLDTSWCWGNYFGATRQAEAWADFIDRVDTVVDTRMLPPSTVQ